MVTIACNNVQMTIEASDSGTTSLSSQTSITVNILDVNDNLPEFEVRGKGFVCAVK